MDFNKQKTHKLPAFTVMELLVSMFIFAIIVSVAFVLLMNVTKGIGHIKKDSAYFMNYHKFVSLFEKDMMDALYLKEEAGDILCVLPKGEVLYQFTSENIIRSSEDFDVQWPLKLLNKEVFYLDETDWLQSVDFKIAFHGEELPLFLYKEYKAKAYIKYQLENAY